MKPSKILFIYCVLVFGLISQSSAQITLPEVIVKAVKYKYLSAVDQKDLAEPVKLLERQAAIYDVRTNDYYEEDYDTYFVSFYLPEGKILASYDKEGKLLSTAERFKNIRLPKVVNDAVVSRYPEWSIAKDFYLVNYFDDMGAKKVYKMLLVNGDKRLRVKTNEKGEFL